MPKQQKLTIHSDFERMKVFQQPVSVYQHGILIDEKVIIKSHNDDVVVTKNKEKYFKAICDLSGYKILNLFVWLKMGNKKVTQRVTRYNIQ